MSRPGARATVAWSREDGPGLERLVLIAGERGSSLAGTVVRVEGEGPIELRYRVECGPAWETRSVRVERWGRIGSRTLELARDAAGSWRVDGDRRPELDVCVDVDLGWTPATNTLPIRRLGLAVGEGRDLVAAWVRPDMVVRPLRQRYERIGTRRYRYESRGGRFRVELDVDGNGLVLDYPGLWRRPSGGMGPDEAPGSATRGRRDS